MRKSLTALATAGFLLLHGGTLSAQNHRQALGLHGGGSWFSELSPAESIETRLETGWLAGLHVDNWASNGRVGLRLGASYADRRLATGSRSPFKLYSGELALLFRVLPAEPGRFVAPYIAAGGGVMHVNAPNGANPAQDDYHENPVTSPIASIAAGADLFASSPLGLQIEIGDRIYIESPFGDPALADGFSPVHQVVGRLAVMVRTGRTAAPPPVLAATPRPLPEPEAQAPAPVSFTSTVARPDSAAPQRCACADDIAALEARVDALEREIARPTTPAPAPMTAPAAPPTTTTVAAERLFTVQIAAYEDATAASVLADRARALGVPVWISTVTLGGRTFHRVRVGATPSRVAALELAQRIQAQLMIQTWVTHVEPPDAPSDDIVAATHAATTGS